jgi:hypothetical protein
VTMLRLVAHSFYAHRGLPGDTEQAPVR